MTLGKVTFCNMQILSPHYPKNKVLTEVCILRGLLSRGAHVLARLSPNQAQPALVWTWIGVIMDLVGPSTGLDRVFMDRDGLSPFLVPGPGFGLFSGPVNRWAWIKG